MENKRFALVLFLAFVFCGAMFIAPMGPVRQAETSSTPIFSAEEVEMFEEYQEMVSQPDFKPEIDPILAEWQNGGDISTDVVMRNGNPSVLVYGTADLDMNELSNIVDIDWKVNMGLFQIAKVILSSEMSLDTLAAIDGVTSVAADMRAFPMEDEFVKYIDEAPPSQPGTDMENIKLVVDGYDASTDFSVTGDGVVVGVVDTGVDFGHPALQDAYNGESFDCTGYGLVYTAYHGNTTPVANATLWLEQGNILTYVSGGNTFLNLTLDFDPYVNYRATGLIGYTMQYYVYVYAGAWGVANITDFFEDYMWEDIQVPDWDTVNGNYSFGYLMQQRGFPSRVQPYAKLFAPALVYNTSGDAQKVVIDWDYAEAWNAFWTGGLYYESLDFNVTADRNVVIDMLDMYAFNFTDDITAGEEYDWANPIVAHDYTGDLVDDMSFGALAWGYDDGGFFADEELFNGIRSDNDAFFLHYDARTHGTAVAAHIAGAGVEEYYDADNNRTVKFEGIAPGAKIIAVPALTAGSWYGAFLWACGFDLDLVSGDWEYTGEHQADLISNSWGWVTEPFAEFDYISMTHTILSVPDVLDPAYPGVLHVFSAGNEGGGFMTAGPPGSAAGVLTVGASTESNWLNYLYGPTQTYEGIASFSSKGPAFSGYVKPDVLAPGSAGYSANPWYAQYMQQYWDGPYWGWGTYLNTTLFGGTSQAAPVTAGCAALLVEYLNDNALGWDASTIKTILQSTADDLGYDPATQGFGRVNIYAAIDFADGGGGYWTHNVDSFNNLADWLDMPWHKYGTGPGTPMGGVAPDNENFTFPRDFADGGLYFGILMPGTSATVHVNLMDTFAGGVMTTAPSGNTMQYMRMAEMVQFTGTTFSYNDTIVVDDQMYGFFNLSDEIGADFDTYSGMYSYMTVGVAFDAADLTAGDPWMFLYDWEDKNSDDMPNLWNTTHGDELHRLTNAGDYGETNILPWATTLSDLDTAILGDFALVIHDPTHDSGGEWWNATDIPGNDFTCTVIFWEADVAAEFGIVDDASDTYTWNVTLNVPADADPGIYQGYMSVDSGALRIPWSYNVMGNLTADEGEVTTLVDDWGAELSPYDNAMYGCMDADPDDWDFRSYAFYNKHATAEYFGVRVVWDATGNDMFVAVLDENATVLASGSAGTPTTTAVIAEVDGAGNYFLMVHPIALDGTVSLPVNYTIEIMWYTALTNEPVILSYTSDDRTGVTAVAENDTLWGDHAVFNATYPAFNLANMPEFEITWIQFGFLSGLYFQESGTLVVPDSSYDPFGGTVQQDQFAWMLVEGIIVGDVVDMVVDFSNGDCDIMAWWADTDQLGWTYDNNLFGAQMSTGAHPEVGTFTADRSGDMMVGIFDYDLSTGTFEVTVDTRVGIYMDEDGPEITYDSYEFLKNGTFQVQVLAETDTNIGYEVNYVALTFENFFSPEMLTVNVAGTGAEKTITWTYDDLNAGDEHFFEVLLSADDGLTYQLLARNITTTTYVWDSTGFLERTTYRVMVRVFDNDAGENPTGIATGTYWTGLSDAIESTSFAAGTVVITTTTTTTTTPPPTTEPPVEPIDPVILGLIAGIGAGVVVVLILFLVKRR